MSFELKKYKLAEIADVQTGPFGSQLHKDDYVPHGTPIITVEHLGENFIIHENTPKVSNDDALRLSKYSLCEGDIVFSRVGSVDRRAYVSKKEHGWLFSGRCLRVRVNKKDKIDPKYLSYYFGLESFREYVRSIAVGATMPSLNTKIMSSLEIQAPELNVQVAISKLLSSLDNKIELNNAINKNLEEMAQALFKRWFVDFEFPNENGEPYKSSGGEFEESELGLIPKGWRVGILDDLCEMIFSGGTPSTKNEAYWNGDLFWLSSGETRNRYIISTEKRITQDGVENSSTRLAKKYDVVIASAGQGSTRGQTSICLVDTYINQSIIAVRAKKGSTFPSYLFFNLSTRYEELRQISDSNSIRGSLTTNTLKKLKIIIPPIEIQYKICSVLDQVINCAEYYQRQNEYLTQIRDTLLPKLMSGEIRVPVERDNSATDLPKVAESNAIYQP